MVSVMARCVLSSVSLACYELFMCFTRKETFYVGFRQVQSLPPPELHKQT